MMKNSILITAAIFAYCILITTNCFSQGTAINANGANPDNSAILDAASTTKGFLMPRMTTAERNAIVSPAQGLMIYNLDCNNFDYYNGTSWASVNPVAASVIISSDPSGAMCSGTNVTFTAVATFGGPSPSYQWKVNGSDVGTNSSIYTSSTLQNGDQISCEMTSNAACVTVNPATSNTITMIINQQPTITGTTPGSRNGTGSVTLGASASAGTVNWYAADTGGSSLGTGTSFITPVLCSTTTYYADATLGSCISSPRTLVTATLNKLFQVDNGCSLTNNLLAYYKLENTSDFWSTNDLTNYNSVSFNSGKVNNAADFGTNNTTKYLHSTAALGVNGGPVTLAAWVNLSSVPSNNSYVLCTQMNSTNNTSYYLIYTDASGVKQIGFVRDIMCNGGFGTYFTYTLTPGTWYNLTGTYDGTDLRLYVNGVLQAGPTTAGGTGSCGFNEIEIGGRVNNSTHPYSGKIDEYSIWNRALTQQEINDFYNGGNGQTMQ